MKQIGIQGSDKPRENKKEAIVKQIGIQDSDKPRGNKKEAIMNHYSSVE